MHQIKKVKVFTLSSFVLSKLMTAYVGRSSSLSSVLTFISAVTRERSRSDAQCAAWSSRRSQTWGTTAEDTPTSDPTDAPSVRKHTTGPICWRHTSSKHMKKTREKKLDVCTFYYTNQFLLHSDISEVTLFIIWFKNKKSNQETTFFLDF